MMDVGQLNEIAIQEIVQHLVFKGLDFLFVKVLNVFP